MELRPPAFCVNIIILSVTNEVSVDIKLKTITFLLWYNLVRLYTIAVVFIYAINIGSDLTPLSPDYAHV